MVRRRGTRIAVAALALVVLLGAVVASASGAGAPAKFLRLAFVKAGGKTDQVWVSDVAGRHATHLGPGDVPLVSPYGTRVAATLSGAGSALAVYGPGSSVHKFFNTNRVGAQALAWSPESRYVAVELFGANPGKHDHNSGLAIVDTQTNTSKVIAKGAICGASFSPALPDRLVYGQAPAGTFCLSGHVNVFAANPDGSQRLKITTDGRSLNPVWGPTQIAFDREQVRGGQAAPAYQIWLMNPNGSDRKQVTHTKVPSLLEGLVPMQFSADGERLLTEYVGQDTSEAWTIQLATAKVRELKISGASVTAGGLSLDGTTVLVDDNGFLNSASAGVIETLPFTGGKATVLVRHAVFPSWNR